MKPTASNNTKNIEKSESLIQREKLVLLQKSNDTKQEEILKNQRIIQQLQVELDETKKINFDQIKKLEKNHQSQVFLLKEKYEHEIISLKMTNSGDGILEENSLSFVTTLNQSDDIINSNQKLTEDLEIIQLKQIKMIEAFHEGIKNHIF
jgi:DNA polymerase III psi subunit